MGVGRRAVGRAAAGAMLSAGIAAGGAAVAPRPARGAAPPGRLREAEARDLPALTFADAAGGTTDLGAFAGRGVVLNLWATWCAPCVAEMPALDRAAAALEGEGIAVLPLSSDRGGKAVVAAFYARVGVRHLGVWLDPGMAAGRALGVRGLPTTVLIGRDGRERARLEGAAEWDSGEMLAAVRRVCGGAG